MVWTESWNNFFPPLSESTITFTAIAPDIIFTPNMSETPYSISFLTGSQPEDPERISRSCFCYIKNTNKQNRL